MAAIALGLLAALGWGLHDFAVRYASQRASIYAALLTVLGSGLLLMAPVLWLSGFLGPISGQAILVSCLSGIAFAIAGVGLYKAFSIGPVGLVAPVVGAYPVLSVTVATLSGDPVSVGSWLAVFMVMGGIAITSRGQSGAHGDRRTALLWAALAALAFFATFSLGQHAAQGPETGAALLITRLAALFAVLVFVVWRRIPAWPTRENIPLFVAMGALDTIALSAVMIAGNLPLAAYAAVASSVFGIVTIVLARVFLGEMMRPMQWFGVVLVFAGIGYLAIA